MSEHVLHANRIRAHPWHPWFNGRMTDDAHFLAAIHDDPRDLSRRQVYADWLDDRGDVRGEYVRLQVERSGLSLENDPEGRLVPLCDRMMTLRGEIDDRWLAEMEQPSVMIGNPTPFATKWIGTNLAGLREFDGSFRSDPYEVQPDLDLEHCAELGFDEIDEPLDDDYFQATRQVLRDVVPALNVDNVALPAEVQMVLEELNGFASLVLGARCPVRLRHLPTPCPLLSRVRILPFCYDSQLCFFAMLYLHPSGGHCVVVSGDRRFLGEEPEEDEDWGRLEANVHFTSPSFTTFVHRWRLDHSLWEYASWLRSERGEHVTRSLLDARSPERPNLTPELQAYADHLMRTIG